MYSSFYMKALLRNSCWVPLLGNSKLFLILSKRNVCTVSNPDIFKNNDVANLPFQKISYLSSKILPKIVECVSTLKKNWKLIYIDLNWKYEINLSVIPFGAKNRYIPDSSLKTCSYCRNALALDSRLLWPFRAQYWPYTRKTGRFCKKSLCRNWKFRFIIWSMEKVYLILDFT